MSITAARLTDPYELANAPQTALSGTFGVAVMESTKRTQFSANTNAAITANSAVTEDSTTEETEHFDLLAPTTLSWEDQVRSKLDAGLEGEAYNLIMTNLDGRSMEYVMEKMAEFHKEFTDRGFNDLARDLGNVMHMLSSDFSLSNIPNLLFQASNPYGNDSADSDLGMNIHKEPSMDLHLNRQNGKTKPFMTQYLGIGNPTLRL